MRPEIDFSQASKEVLAPVDRRAFLKSSLVAGGALVIAFHWPVGAMKKAMAAEGAAPAPSGPEKYPPAAFIEMAADGTVTIVINKLEMGQGVNTSMAQLIAEEMDLDWKMVRARSSGVNPVYNHTVFGTQLTGGSTALASSYIQYRTIGATAKILLRQAAAEHWKVPVDSIGTALGHVTHKDKGKLPYFRLASQLPKLKVPAQVTLKSPKDFQIIGKSVQRVDSLDKSTGKAIFGADVTIPGMLYAVVARPPVFGAAVKTVDSSAAKLVAGVKEVIVLGDRVAILAESTPAALKGREALKIEWAKTGKESVSSASITEEYRQKVKEKGAVAKAAPELEAQMKKAKRKVEAEFVFPYLAHACMEPMNCTIDFDGKKARIWSGHQMPTVDRDTAAKILGLAPEKVEVTTTYAGGSFGRRANKNSDFVVEAAQIAKVAKRPFKVVWTREDDTRGGYYRPFTLHKASVGLSEKGDILAWDHHIVGQSVVGDSFFEAMMVKSGVDPTMVEGVSDSKYSLPHFQVQCSLTKQHVPVLWWRSVGHTHTAFAMETLMDEIAGKRDALQFRKKLLSQSPRHLAVLSLLEKHSPWGKKAPRGRAYGLAVHESFGSVVGQLVEVSNRKGKPRVHKVWCAVHCGKVVNPEGAKAQIEGGIVYGLSAALYEAVPIANGEPQVSNFHDYPALRMSEMPEVETHFVESEENPTGLGEPGTPPIAPALANALFRLTGKRIRSLPVVKG
jgi:isoquinoline 1-oxidoreductase subunit beta